jgi:hypothetical protein
MDILERLFELWTRVSDVDSVTLRDAEDEIKKLREALQGLVSDLDDYPAVARLLDTYEYARAALGEKES